MPAFTHEQLLTFAYKARGAARDHDRRRLESSTLRLFRALSDHLGAERPTLLQATPGDARLLERGQQRVVDLVVELAASAASDEGGCRCERIAENLVAELSLQAGEERRHLPPVAGR